MNAKKANKIFKEVNRPLTLKQIIEKDVRKGYPATHVPRMNENDPRLKKLEKKGYLITHSNSYTYICWSHF